MMQTVRPPTRPTPVTTPSAGVSASWFRAKRKSSWNSEPGIEEELEAIADEELAFVLQLVAVLDVALLDAGALAEVALLSHGGPPPLLTSPRARRGSDRPR